MTDYQPKRLLHMVFGGEVVAPDSVQFKDLSKIHYVGMYPDYQSALAAWRGVAQATVDNAEMRYFVVHIHKLMEPETPGKA